MLRQDADHASRCVQKMCEATLSAGLRLPVLATQLAVGEASPRIAITCCQRPLALCSSASGNRLRHALRELCASTDPAPALQRS